MSPQEYEDKIHALQVIHARAPLAHSALEYCWLYRIGYRLVAQLWREQNYSGIGLQSNYRNVDKYELACKLCELEETYGPVRF